MSDTSDLWNMMHDVRDRVTRIEERSANRDARIADMAAKLDHMHTIFTQAEGGVKVAGALSKAAYGVGGGLFGIVVANWQALKKAFGL